ncbi:MAG: PAS domain S-box protein [Ignavibacteria bacterium]|jgi:PAS domain S-box-containing protein|nr:PAS domain S-box protein [Ignavibacteria bacterium]MCU7504688.1 PAS domain S-box protein [Ignavibacteria bacterium]MCU7516290.1 PAS domain S-box protein [Ignavibacteria bacterium]
MKNVFRHAFPLGQVFIILAGVLFYWVFFVVMHRLLDVHPIPLVIIPVVASCWFWGTKRGLLAGMFIVLSSIFFLIIFHIHRDDTAWGILTVAMSFVLGSAAGWVRGLYDREKKSSIMLAEERKALLFEIEERKKAEDRALWNENFLKTMSNSSPLGILAINSRTDEVFFCNKRFFDIWDVVEYEKKVAARGIKSSEFLSICQRNIKDIEFYQEHFSPSLDLYSLDTATIEITFKDGRVIRRFTSPIMGKNDECLARLFTYEDITEHKKAEYLLSRSYKNEHLIYTVSNMFKQEPFEKIDEAFDSSLKMIGEFLEMDLGFIFMDDPESGGAENIYEWRSRSLSGNCDRLNRLEADIWLSFKDKLLNLEKAVVPDVEAFFSGKSMENEFLLRRGIKSIVIFPVVFNNDLIGFLGFGSGTAKEFPEDAASMLKIISGIYSGAFMRKQKTYALLENEERFRLLVEHSADMISVIDDKGILMYTSEAIERILGYKASERTGISLMEYVHPDDAPKITGITKTLLSKKISSSTPQYIRIKHKDGAYKYLESIFTDQLDNPAIKGIVINSRDFTQQLALQEALRNSRNFLNAIIDNAGDPLFVKDSSYRYTLVNEAYCNLTGFAREQMMGRTDFDFVPKELAERFYEKDNEVFSKGRIENFEVDIVDRDGQKRFVVANETLYKDEKGEKYIISSIRDETKRKELEQEINNALMKEKELNRLKSKFVSMVSHEYRTPLTAILSSAELLELFGVDMEQEEKAEYMDNIKNSVDYLTSLLDDVLLINRSESGRMEYDPAGFELISFCREILKTMMDGTKCRIELRYGFEAKNVCMDKKLIRHILMNLLSNAIKYSSEGATVCFNITSSEGYVNFEVEDSGIGIPFEDQPHLFEPFFRADNVSNIPGSGLGLSIVKSCVELHKGSISFESYPGAGTKFMVSLPDEG